jgi:hypothetical protein
MTARRRIRALGVLAVLCLLAVAGCAPAPDAPAHTLGARCTWPAGLDPQRDGLAVLAGADELVLLDVATGGVRARCGPTGYVWPDPGVATGSVHFPPIDPGWQFAVTSAGVVDLVAGTVVEAPVPGWRTMALPGEGRVLRQRVADGEVVQPDVAAAGSWCVAPRLDPPGQECLPLAGEGAGFPAVGRDGEVGWAPAAFLPVQLGWMPGVVQTDGRRVVQLRLDPTDADWTAVVDASGRAGLIGQGQFLHAPGNAEVGERPAWYTLEELDGAGARARLHVGASSWREIEALGTELNPLPHGAMVVDGGDAVVVALRDRTDTARFVRIAEGGPARVLASLPVGRHPEALLAGMPVILAWPDSAPSIQP